ncbi:ATP synthase subunit gamma C-terminus [Marinobacter santoriniensis NKSG1]|uniref:ATP synthase subunit gamma C-terminus n=1 Tax=Marinobacter santoriniensis NKSG1 TaxID=1288826 RepID=M7CYX9_9GAMM|nr:FoF1 ATP synthase subunit gamma [Marinobacter santoriniensis]EMP57445.1 ATP synthase subunit gamma C-terminus [Marinobacter santoriniensis NKSG1]
MTNRHDLERHRESLSDIRNIMNSMKTLAYMENRKLARFLTSQHAVTRSIEAVAADLLAHFPGILPQEHSEQDVLLVVGTERGFCGSFNHKLAARVQDMDKEDNYRPFLVTIGHKLLTPLADHPRLEATLTGAAVSEEIPSLLTGLVDRLMELQKTHGVMTLSCLFHTDPDTIALRKLIPPFRDIPPREPDKLGPPLIHESPEALLTRLSEQYLLAELQEIFSTSLNAENLNRVTHLDMAVKKLDEKAEDMVRRLNALRQEEIIEEIEVILLNASHVGEEPGGARKPKTKARQ